MLSLYLLLASDGVIVCPKLEQLIFRVIGQVSIHMETIITLAAASASKGAPFKSVKVVSFWEPVPTDGIVELLELVSHVETNVEVDGDDHRVNEDSDEEGWGGVLVVALTLTYHT